VETTSPPERNFSQGTAMARRGEALRRRARRLVEAGLLTRAEIARRCGVQPRTVGRWIAAGGWAAGPGAPKARRKNARGPVEPDAVPTIGPERWEAARRLFEGCRAEPADIAVALGLAASDAEIVFAARGFSRRAEAGLDGATLRRRLRHHVARQIAALDAQLGAAPRAPDSARVLRDVSGLKRVIDALDLEDAARGTEAAGGASAGDGSGPGVGALREAIARRYEAFAGDGAAADLPGEPA
jgi:hypothetical protein